MTIAIGEHGSTGVSRNEIELALESFFPCLPECLLALQCGPHASVLDEQFDRFIRADESDVALHKHPGKRWSGNAFPPQKKAFAIVLDDHTYKVRT